jgi:molecular chaperone DnaK
MAEDNKSLARFELVGIPPAPRGVPQIEVSFDIDANGVVNVTAKDLGTGKKQAIKITATSGLSEDDVKRMLEESQKFRGDDAKKKQVADLRNSAEGLVYTTQKSLAEYGTLLAEQDVALIRSDLEHLERTLEANDNDALAANFKKLEQSSHRLADLIYAEVAKQK